MPSTSETDPATARCSRWRWTLSSAAVHRLGFLRWATCSDAKARSGAAEVMRSSAWKSARLKGSGGALGLRKAARTIPAMSGSVRSTRSSAKAAAARVSQRGWLQWTVTRVDTTSSRSGRCRTFCSDMASEDAALRWCEWASEEISDSRRRTCRGGAIPGTNSPTTHPSRVHHPPFP